MILLILWLLTSGVGHLAFFFSVIVSSQSCDLLPILQTVSLSGLFSTLRSYPWISGRGIVWKDMGRWCCQHLQVKHPWDIVLIVWENELSGPLGK